MTEDKLKAMIATTHRANMLLEVTAKLERNIDTIEQCSNATSISFTGKIANFKQIDLGDTQTGLLVRDAVEAVLKAQLEKYVKEFQELEVPPNA